MFLKTEKILFHKPGEQNKGFKFNRKSCNLNVVTFQKFRIRLKCKNQTEKVASLK